MTFREQVRRDMELVRLAEKRGMHVNHRRVWSDVAKLIWQIVCGGFKLLSCWNPFRELWRLITTRRNYR